MAVPGTCRLQETPVHPSVDENTEEKGGAALRSLSNLFVQRHEENFTEALHFAVG